MDRLNLKGTAVGEAINNYVELRQLSKSLDPIALILIKSKICIEESLIVRTELIVVPTIVTILGSVLVKSQITTNLNAHQGKLPLSSFLPSSTGQAIIEEEIGPAAAAFNGSNRLKSLLTVKPP